MTREQIQRVHDNAYARGLLPMWVIYCHPKDFPDGYVLRPHFAAKGMTTVAETGLGADTAAQLREVLPAGVVCIGREADDDPAILEVWI
jgi:hypothetical protein